MSVPDHLVGAWRRVGLVIDGRRRIDRSDVLWLQSRDWYADIRLPLPDGRGADGGGRAGGGADAGGPDAGDPDERAVAALGALRAFAGRADWDDPHLTWHHPLDSRPDVGEPDIGALSWEDGVVVERGELPGADGRPVRYAEEWLRMTGGGAEAHVDAGEAGVRIAVGRWGIDVRAARGSLPLVATRFDVDPAGAWHPLGEVRGAPAARPT